MTTRPRGRGSSRSASSWRVRARRGGGRVVLARRPDDPVAASAGARRARLARAVAAPHILFRDTARGEATGASAIVPLAHPTARPALTG